MTDRADRWLRLFLLAWSLGHATGSVITGGSILLLPKLAFELMGVAHAPGTLVWHQYIATFVACVGGAFWIGLIGLWRTGSWDRLRFAWEYATLVDLAIGAYVAVQLAHGALEPGWIKVPLTDWTAAAIQGWALLAGWFPDEETERAAGRSLRGRRPRRRTG